MSGVNAHAIFTPPTAGGILLGQLAASPFQRHRHWPVVTARRLLGPARAKSRGHLVFACTLRCQELAYLWDHQVPVCPGSFVVYHEAGS